MEITTQDKTAIRVSVALCIAMLISFSWVLSQFTSGFEVWTYEGRRQLQIRKGLLSIDPVVLRGIEGDTSSIWQPMGRKTNAYLVDFIYTRCPSVCRTLGSEFQQMQAELSDGSAGAGAGAGAGVELVSISFDVDHDRPGTLKRYAKELRADSSRWHFLVPDNRPDASRLLGSLGVVVIPDGMGGFVHNGSIHLLDGAGTLHGLYGLDQWQQALADARRLSTRPGS